MRRPLTLLAWSGLVVVGAGCAATTSRAGAGAIGYVPSAPVGVVAAGAPSTTVAPALGGVPVTHQHLSSGATPASSPSFTVRGTTWPPKKKKALPPLPLAPGGYEAQVSVYPETDFKTGQVYRCSAAVSLTDPGGRALLVTAPQEAGTSARTFVVAGSTSAVAAGVGPVGCDWVLNLFPA